MKAHRHATVASLALAAVLAVVATAVSSVASAPSSTDGARTARFEDLLPSRYSHPLSRSPQLPSDPFWPQAWSLRTLNVPAVWPSAAGGLPTVVAVIDTGVDPAQPDLAGALVPGHDTLATGTGTADENGHGTAVAGIIAARSDNSVGVTSVCGTCSVMPVKVISASGFGDAEHIATGIVWATDHGARVINLSIVLDGPQPNVEAAVRYAHDRGVVIVAAAGNGGGSDPTYPAAYPDVISVAASQEDGTLYPWSQRGPWVDVASPGCSPSTARGTEYTIFCGTSSATASVAGVVALALSAAPAATNVDVERVITETAQPLRGGGVASGTVDALSLVDALRAGAPPANRLSS